MPRILLDRVTKTFGTATILRDLHLEVGSGEFVAVLGRSGSGKSTMLRIIAGLDEPDRGVVQRQGRLAMVFQEARLIPWLSVNANLSLGYAHPDSKTVVRSALEEVGLNEKATDWPSTLSGGQAQRASLARALVRMPEILLLDEPFGALDALTRLEMQNLVHRLKIHHGFSSVMVTHDVEEAIRLADRVIVLGDGAVLFDERMTTPPPREPILHPDMVRKLLTVLGVR